MVKALTLLLLALLPSTAEAAVCKAGQRAYVMPAGVSLYCSETWALEADCKANQGIVMEWSVNGSIGADKWKILPWAEQQVTIRGIELTELSGPDFEWMMAGNGFVNDMMMFTGRGERHGRHDFPAGTGMPIQGRNDPRDASHEHIDLHAQCREAGHAVVYYTIYYTIP